MAEEENDALSESNSSFLSKCLDSDELSLIQNAIQCKIERAFEETINGHLVEKALLQTTKTNHESEISSLRLELEKKTSQVDDITNKLREAENEIQELNEKVSNMQAEVEKANSSCKKMQYEWQDFKTQRDLACDEKDSLLAMIDRRNSELMELRTEKAEMRKTLETAIKAKIVALENAEEVQSTRISLEFKEKRIEQESNLLKSQLQSLNRELDEKTNELLSYKRSQSVRAVTIEAELAAKTEELRIALETINALKEANEKLTEKSNDLLEKLASQRESADLVMDNFHQELAAQTKLAQLYKDMSSENDNKTQKLTNAIEELKSLLEESVTKYGDLETKMKETTLNLNDEIARRDDCIALLKQELQDANDLLETTKQDNLDIAVSNLSPAAAAASRLIKSGMTLTQIYTQYARVAEELLLEKEENRRLNLALTTIVAEVEEKAPILRQQRQDYEKAVAAAESLSNQLDAMIVDSKVLNQECTEAKKLSGHLTRENERLQKQIVDLSRQVCYLVKAVEEARGGVVSHDTAYELGRGTAQDVISRHLVTFSTIEDLQENNQKLLALVRQFSEKHEAIESVSNKDYLDLQEKKEKLEERVNELVDEMDRQTKMIELIRCQSATYKKLYQQAMGGLTEPNEAVSPSTPLRTAPGPITSTPISVAPGEVMDTSDKQNKLKDAKETIKKLEDEMDKLRTESREKERSLNSQLEKLNAELKESIYNNSKMVARAEYNEEKSKVLETNLKSMKKQIEALEEKNRTILEICGKHEQSVITLKDQLMETQTKLARAEVRMSNCQQENFLLKASEARLIKEKEVLHRERVGHSVLMQNLDGLKTALERSEAEGKLRLEIQLGDALKECSALRATMKEEKDRFKELTTSLERQTTTAKERMLEEKTLADKARAELLETKNEIEEKNKMIAELNVKIRELKNEPVRSVVQSATSSLDTSVKRVKDLEKQVRDLENENARLHIQLKSAVGGSKQYAAMATSAEVQLREMTEEHHKCSLALAEKEKECSNRIKEMEIRVKVAEEQVALLKVENEKALRIKTSSVQEMSSTLSSVESTLHSKDSELSKLRGEIESLNKQLTAAKDEITDVKKEVAEAEAKYAQEVISHSKAIQAMDSAQKQMAEIKAEIEDMRLQRDKAVDSLTVKSSAWSEQELKAKEELNETIKRMQELEEQNSILHESLQKLNDELAILLAKIDNKSATPNIDTSLNTSADLSSQAQDELIRVIKFLRQEKDIASTKCEVLQAETTRLKSQLAVTQKQFDEVNKAYSSMKETKDIADSASAKQAELLRKVESLNAVTDSNRLLREERNRYKAEADSMRDSANKTATNLVPLQNEVKALKEQIETLTTENKGLLLDAVRWKTKATQLSERAKLTPEDWRRLTNERENLAKQWQNEKNINEKLEESLKKSRQENTTLNEQSTELRKQLLNETNEKRRLSEELNNTKQKLTQSDQELQNSRAQEKKFSEDLGKATDENTAKEAVIIDLRSKETQIRKIAKKYKMQFEELTKTVEEGKAKQAEEDAKKQEEAQKPLVIPEAEQERFRAEGRAETSAQLSEIETRMSEKVKELEGKASTAVEEIENYKKENEALKKNMNEKEERALALLKNVRSRLTVLGEQKSQLEQELSQYRGSAEHARDENDSKLIAMKANYDAIIARMEKERDEQCELLNQERERIKTLQQRIAQLQRTFDKQKPSTSSQPLQKSTMEPPTANIKPMAGSSTARKQKQNPVTVYPVYWSSPNETPFASIRPVQSRTLAVQPTSLTGKSTCTAGGSSGLLVPPQQPVHTTGNSGEALSSSPTSSHTDYMPATSSATPIRVVIAPVSAQFAQEGEESAGSEPTAIQPQTVAMVLPRVEATTGSPAPDLSSVPGQASSSNSTVTTTQAGLKRPRDVDGDSSTGIEEQHSKASPQSKRSRVNEVFHQVSHSEVGEEYQVPTSSQRDQEDDMVIMLDSEDDGNADEGDVEEPDDDQGFEEEDNGEGFEVGSYSRDGQDMEMVNFDEGPDIDEENAADGSNEVEIIEDSNEVPNQSGGVQNVGGVAAVPAGEEQQQQSSEATSSGNDAVADHVVVSHAASSQPFRTRCVPPLNRPQTSLQGYDEGGDDSIVPSTPTLYLPRRADGFGEAVSSPQVPHQRFTFSEPGPGSSRRGDDGGVTDDPGTGRSVPTTPLQVSPQETNQDQSVDQHLGVNITQEEIAPTDPSGDEESRGQEETLQEPETVTIEDENENDGVTSEGEKIPVIGGEPIEEGREAEASEPIARIGGTARRSGRLSYARRAMHRRPTPIVWHEPGSSGLPSTLRTVPTTRGTSTPRGRGYRGSRRTW